MNIVFSLYGDIPKYVVGAIENARLAKTIYPNWRCVFYIDDSVPDWAVIELIKHGASIRYIPENHQLRNGPLWRYLAAADGGIWLMRDVDSRLNVREKSAVDEWLKTSKEYHIMRDHQYHSARIMAGMFGGRSPIVDVLGLIMRWGRMNDLTSRFADQLFLREVVYPSISGRVLIHDAFKSYQDEISCEFPTPYIDRYVGESMDEYGVPNADHLRIRRAC